MIPKEPTMQNHVLTSTPIPSSFSSCPFPCLRPCWSQFPSLGLPTWLSPLLSQCLFPCPPKSPKVSLSIYLSVYPPVSQSVSLSVSPASFSYSLPVCLLVRLRSRSQKSPKVSERSPRMDVSIGSILVPQI